MKLPIVLGHRGARFTAPENSIPSFLNAVKFGADGVELDVHLTKDKKLVVIHDSTLRRINGSKTLIRSLTLKEIKNLDISHLIKKGSEEIHIILSLFKLDREGEFFIQMNDATRNKKYRYLIEIANGTVRKLKRVIIRREGKLIEEKEFFLKTKRQETDFHDVHIPMLSEALSNLKGSFVDIEIKRGEKFYPGIIDAVVKESESFGYKNIMLCSFNYQTLKEIKRRYPFLNVNRLYEILLNPVKASKEVDGANPFFLLLSEKGITRLHKSGKTVYPWVVNKASDIIRFMAYGVDGIITDRPFYAIQIREQLRELLNALG